MTAMLSTLTAMLDVSYIIPSWTTSNTSDKQESADAYNVLLIGAGNVNFGEITSNHQRNSTKRAIQVLTKVDGIIVIVLNSTLWVSHQGEHLD